MTCQIWIGDSTQATQLIDEPIHAIITDPPYGMDFMSQFVETEHGKKFNDRIENDGDLESAIKTFWAAMTPLVDKAADQAEMYVFTRWNLIQPWVDAINQLKPFEVKNILIWDKLTPGMGDIDANWAYSYEVILYAKKGRRPIPHRRSSVISVPRTPSTKHIHPTEKPVHLLEILIEQSTDRNDLVVDPFAGSGSTIVAAERLGRRAIGIELSEKFGERARKRLGQNTLDLF